VANALSFLALNCFRQGKYTEAGPLWKRELAIREQAVGPDHPALIMPLNNLAENYNVQRNHAQAELLLNRVLRLQESASGPDSPEMIDAINRLAFTRFAQTNYTEAEPLFRRALALVERAREANHPEVATALNFLAVNCIRQEKYTEAEPLLKRALAIRRKDPKKSIDLMISLANLGRNYHLQGKDSEAESFYQEALALQDELLAPDDPDAVKTLEDYAAVLRKLNRVPQAAELESRAKSIQAKNAPREAKSK
jgi:tetratricopeptide (TPR) repeat protein